MVVRLDAGREAVRAYVAEQAARGRDHVLALLKADRDAMFALIDDLDEREGNVQPAPGEWSVAEVLQHLNPSFPRSRERLATLSSGRPFTNPAVAAGSLPDQVPPSFEESRRTFKDGEDAVIAIVEQADPRKGLDLTAEHALYGPFNWLEWAVYSHHVHLHDHLGQVGEIRRALGK